MLGANWTTVNWAQLSNEYRANEQSEDRAEWNWSLFSTNIIYSGINAQDLFICIGRNAPNVTDAEGTNKHTTRPSKLCGFCIFHTESCEPLIEKWFVCYAFFSMFQKMEKPIKIQTVRNGEKRGETMRNDEKR